MLKIKNIRDYRTYYKNQVRDLPTRDENFIGNYYSDVDAEGKKKKFGWFEIYHGDKEGYGKAEAGIENFLQSFLDMARDGQAVYEFLQNAVDAGSTHFTMVWGEEESDGNQYLLVANNGEMFSFNSIRSILNVGSSTKSADSQTIGKFGIGFKLAHRLVGKDNGLQELLHENSGPVLFSWKNHELNELAAGEGIEPQKIEFENIDDQKYQILDENPWLFKILITCFPCLPENEFLEDLPRLVNGEQSKQNPFDQKELAVLSSWVKKLLPSLNETTYKEGSLFFIRLGKGKEADLADKNLREGVRFSLAILNKTADKKPDQTKVLGTVQLNDGDPITIPELNYLTFGISKTNDLEDYIYIRFGVRSIDLLQRDQLEKLEREADIEVLIGFQDYNNIQNSFEGAPNFYLYFPLSEEVHNFNYILHCNAFYKGSSRTFLHRASNGEEGINERLLGMIVTRLFIQLTEHAYSDSSEDNLLFLNLYAALLTSGESKNQERAWIKEPYIDPITIELGKIIPVADAADSRGYTIAAAGETVFVKATNIEMDSNWLKEPIKWFFWGGEHTEFQTSAAEKLKLNSYNVFSLLENPGVYEQLNIWLNKDTAKIRMLLTELSAVADNDLKSDAFIQNLIRLDMLAFSDGSVVSFIKLDELQDEGYLILHNKLSDIRDLLLKCDFKVSDEDFNAYKVIEKYQNNLSQKSQLRGHTAVTRLFSQFIKDESALALSTDEKFRIFTAIRDLNSDNRGDRIRELKLYCNKGGQVVYFKNLLLETTHSWLNSYVIDPKEYQQELRTYLLSKDPEIYSGIIYPFWPQISAQLLSADKSEILTKIDELFSLYKPVEGEKELLKNYELLFFKGESVACTNLFYSSGIAEITETLFVSVQNALYDFYQIQIPDRFFLPFADLEVYKLAQSTPDFTEENVEIPAKQLALVLDFCTHTNCDFFGQLLIKAADGKYITTAKGDCEQYFSKNKLLIAYTEKYFEGAYSLLPAEFAAYSSLLSLQNDVFTSTLIENYEEDDLETELDFVEALLTESAPLRKAIFDLIEYMPLDTEWENLRQNQIYLNLIAGVLQYDATAITAVDNKLALKKGEQSLELVEIDQANDIIKVKRGEKEFPLSQAEILNLADKQSIKLVKDFAKACVDKNLLLDSQATAIFKLSGLGISEELVKKFKAALTEKLLINAHQLAFLLLSGKFTPDEIKEYSVSTAGEEPCVLQGPYVLSGADVDIYHADYVFGDAYVEFKGLIGLGAAESFQYGEGDNDVIVPRYLFVNGCKYSILNGEADKVILLDELFAGLKLTPAETLVKDHGQQEWETVLKFNPSDVVIHELSLADEQLPEEVESWLQTGDKNGKTRLLIALGSSGPNSRIARLRKWLQSPSSVEFVQQDVHFIPDGLLYNSLEVMCGKALVPQPDLPLKLGINDARLKLIEIISGVMIEKGYKSFPLLTYQNPVELIFNDPDEVDVYLLTDEFSIALKGQDELISLYKALSIAWMEHIHADNFLPMLKELPIDEKLFAEGTEEEHTEPFYKRWKLSELITLKRVPLVKAKIFAQVNDVPLYIGIKIPLSQYILKDEEEQVEIIYSQLLTLEQLLFQLDEEGDDITEAIADLIKARDAALAGFYHMMSMAETAEGEATMYKALQKAMMEEGSRTERRDLLEQMESSAPYSYQWFIAFLEYMLTYEQLASTTTQKSLNFQSISRYMIEDVYSEKYFMLYGAANLIPVNVDSFKNFNVTLVFRNRRKEIIHVDNVSARGQDMLIYCSTGLESDILTHLEHVVNVSISFSPVLDLLNQLYLSFSNRDIISPWDDIKEALPPIEFIYGPPGTGKTTSICRMLEDDFKKNRNVRCLILTPTNKASDVIVKKIIDSGSELKAVRLGGSTDPELEAHEDEIYQTSLSLDDMAYYNIVASTIHRYPYFKVLGEPNPDQKLFQLIDYWDYVVIDEASMVSLPYLVFILMSFSKHRKLPKFIVAGDPMQIPPVLDLSDKDMEDTDIADMNVYTMLGIKSFKREEQILRPVDSIKNLDVQFRSVEAIGKIFSKISYQDQLGHGRDFVKEPVKQLPKAVAEMLPDAVSFINFPLNVDHAIYEKRQLLYSSYHLYAGLLVAELISFFSKSNTDEHWTIGVITPYKAQALITNKLIRSKKISEKLTIICNTVHSFQGDQCDLVIFLVNPNNYRYTDHAKSLLSKEYIYNVAISRARDYLWILNPFNHLTNPHIVEIVDISNQINGKSKIHTSGQLENALFGENKYLEQYSFVTGHDNINIYGQTEMKYFIRANDFAIDVQTV